MRTRLPIRERVAAAELLWEEYARTRDRALEAKLVEAYLWVVETKAKKLDRRLAPGVQRCDLVQWGAMGLLDAIRRFEPSRGFKFTTYAQLRVAGAMIDALRDFSTYTRQSMDFSKILSEANSILRHRLSRPPTPQETADYLSLSPERLKEISRRQARKIESLSTLANAEDPDKDSATGTYVDPHAEGPLERAELNDSYQAVMHYLLTHCKLTQALMIRMHYLEHTPFKEIAKALCVCKERVCQIHKTTMNDLRARFAPAA